MQGFGLKTAARPRAAPLAEARPETRDFVTAMGDGALASAAPKQAPPKLVIAPLPNTFETGKGKRPRGVPSFIPESSADAQQRSGERFEAAVANETAQADGVAFGLNVRARPAPAAAPAPEAGEEPRERSFVERALAGRAASREAAEAEALRNDLRRLPDSAGADAYEAMPVDAFGEAMLRGMGWREGAGVGRGGRAAPAPVQYVPRPQLLGLGASAAAAPPPPAGGPSRPLRPGEARPGSAPQLALPVGPDGRVRHVRGLDERLVVQFGAGAVVGKTMVVSQPHGGAFDGLAGTVERLEPPEEGRSARAQLRLAAGGELVRLRCRELADAGSVEAEAALARRRMPPPPAAPAAASAAAAGAAAAAPAAPPWLAPHVRVRIVSETLGGGRLYLKKGTVCDITQPGECTLLLEEGGQMLDGVPQAALETVLPRKPNGRLLVVSGREKGQRAVLLSRDAAAGSAHVRLCADLAVLTLPMDAVAEYVGPLDGED